MALAAGTYKGRIGGSVYQMNGLGNSGFSNSYMGANDPSFYHGIIETERRADVVLLGRTPVQARMTSAGRKALARDHQLALTYAGTPFATKIRVPATTQTLTLAGVVATVAGCALGALFL